MSIGKVSDIVHILNNNNNFQATLNTWVFTLLPLKLFRLLRRLLWPLLLTPGKDIRLCTTSIECYMTNYKIEHTLYSQRRRVTTRMPCVNCLDIWEAVYFDTSYNWGVWRGSMKNVKFCSDWCKIDWDINMLELLPFFFETPCRWDGSQFGQSSSSYVC